MPIPPAPATAKDPIVIATGNPHKVEELRAIFGEAGIPVVGLADLPGGSAAFREPEETGGTFEENAAIKALAYARQTGRVCVADDSGLEVDALGGAPGVISSHYCTDGRETGLGRAERDRLNNERLLRELRGTAPERRGARFVCVMAAAAPSMGPGGTGVPPVLSSHRPPKRPNLHIAHRNTEQGAGTEEHRRDACATACATECRVIATSRGTFEGRIGPETDVPRGSHGFGYDPLFLVAPEFARTSAELTPAEKNRLSHRAAAAKMMAERLRGLV